MMGVVGSNQTGDMTLLEEVNSDIEVTSQAHGSEIDACYTLVILWKRFSMSKAKYLALDKIPRRSRNCCTLAPVSKQQIPLA